MEKILKLFSYSMILAIAINMMSPLMIYAAAKPLPVNDYPTSSSAMSQVEIQKQLAVEQKKAQEEMYKAMGLSTAEIEYLEKNDFEAIKTRLDKYVTYDKDGYAKMAKITSAQSRKDGISSREISIGMKMVEEYNKNLKKKDAEIRDQANSRSSSQFKIVKTIQDRGVRFETQETSALRGSWNNSTGFESWYWWGVRIFVSNNDVQYVINQVNSLGNGLTTYGLVKSLWEIVHRVSSGALYRACISSTMVCASIIVGLGINFFAAREANIQCGRKGIFIDVNGWVLAGAAAVTWYIPNPYSVIIGIAWGIRPVRVC